MFRGWRKITALVSINLAVFAGAFVMIEGLSSTALFLDGLARVQTVAERRHTQYDPQLGWVNRPNVAIADMYGPGVSLNINSQGFRNDRDFPREVPLGKTRIVCAGDSFTLGYGVSNEQTWCQQLANRAPQIETINMGQGGYGVDQAYLWYKRDGVELRHNVLLFAFITLDFEHMHRPEFAGYGKPFFAVANDALKLSNVPVPQKNVLASWLYERHDVARKLRSYELVEALLTRAASTNAQVRESTGQRPGEPELVSEKIFADLARLSAANGSTLVLVYLPFRTAQKEDLRWRQHVRDVVQRQGIFLVDLLDLFNAIPPNEVGSLYIPEGAIAHRHAAGHYSVKGNELVAEALLERLQQLLPERDLARKSVATNASLSLPDREAGIVPPP